MKRVRTGELVAAGGAVVLLVAMFLEWYGAAGGGEGLTAWDAFSVTDVVLALVVLAGLALLAFQIVGRGPALPVAIGVVTASLAFVALLLVLYRILNQPGSNDAVDVRLGAWLGLAATAAVWWGAWKALSDERPRPADPPSPAPERRPTPA